MKNVGQCSNLLLISNTKCFSAIGETFIHGLQSLLFYPCEFPKAGENANPIAKKDTCLREKILKTEP